MPQCAACVTEPEPPVRVPHTVYVKSLYRVGGQDYCRHHIIKAAVAAGVITDRLRERDVKLALGRALYDPGDPMGKLFFNILATFAEFETDLIRMRTRKGMAIARARGKLRGKQPKLSDRQQRELCRMHATGEYSISDLAELCSVSRPTVYRTLNRRLSP